MVTIRNIARKTVIFILVLFIVGTILFLSKEFIANYYVRLNMDNIQLPQKGEKVLVFSPHNDDEVLGPGELISKSLKNGAEVKVVFITNGDGFKNAIQLDYLNLHPKPLDFIKFGYTRQGESINALKKLGLSENNIIFLGYPDGGIAYLWNAHWDKNNPYTSNFTQTNKSPYRNSYTKDTSYTGENLFLDMTKIIGEYKPDYIVMPHPNDRHPDHWAVNAFEKYTLATMNYAPKKQLLYLVHRGDWPTPLKRNTSLYLVPPKKLIDMGTEWRFMDMSDEEINKKSEAIQCYKSQFRTLKPLITAFERKNELFGEYNNIKIKKYERNDNEIRPEESNKIIVDPLQDALTLELSRGSDISAIYSEISKEKNLHIFVETDSNIEKLTSYNINMVFFISSKVSRLNLQVKDNKITEKNIGTNSINNIEGIKHEVSGKFIHIVIPNSKIDDFNHMFINAASSVEDHLLDKTAWRMIDKD